MAALNRFILIFAIILAIINCIALADLVLNYTEYRPLWGAEAAGPAYGSVLRYITILLAPILISIVALICSRFHKIALSTGLAAITIISFFIPQLLAL
jgi:uncharacterized membrane protein